MLRTSEKVDGEKPVGDRVDVAMEMQARRKAASRRTAWIIGALALAFFIASLVQGHFSQIPILH
jgi:hypothetical protein